MVQTLRAEEQENMDLLVAVVWRLPRLCLLTLLLWMLAPTRIYNMKTTCESNAALDTYSIGQQA